MFGHFCEHHQLDQKPWVLKQLMIFQLSKNWQILSKLPIIVSFLPTPVSSSNMSWQIEGCSLQMNVDHRLSNWSSSSLHPSLSQPGFESILLFKLYQAKTWHKREEEFSWEMWCETSELEINKTEFNVVLMLTLCWTAAIFQAWKMLISILDFLLNYPLQSWGPQLSSNLKDALLGQNILSVQLKN